METYTEYAAKQLKALTSIASPSGYTREVKEYLLSTLKEMG